MLYALHNITETLFERRANGVAAGGRPSERVGLRTLRWVLVQARTQEHVREEMQ